MKRLMVGLLLWFAGAAAALAQPAPPEDLAYFVGAWDITATDAKGGGAEAFRYRVEPAGAWISGAGEGAGFQARDLWGRDPMSGEILRVIFDGSGTFATVRSAGWQGDRLVLEGEARSKGGVIRVRETITRVGPGEFKAVWEAFRDGAWSAYSVERVIRRTT